MGSGGDQQQSAGGGAPELHVRRDTYEEARTLRFLKELAAANPERRNWTGIFISIVVIAAFCGLIFLAVVLASPDTFKDGDTSRAIHLDDLLTTGRFQPRRFNGTWISDHEFVFVCERGGVHIFDAANQSTTEILDPPSVGLMHFQSVSANREYALLVERNSCPLWDQEACSRTIGKYFIVHMKTRRKKYLTLEDSEGAEISSDFVFSSGIWSTHDHALAAVHENDIYFFPSPFDGRDVRRLTKASSSSVRNGNPDYLYTARMYGDRPAIWFNHESSHVLYLRQDNSGVDEISLPIFEKTPVSALDPVTSNSSDASFDQRQQERRHYTGLPKWKTFHFPMVGRTCPKISVHLISLGDGTSLVWDPADPRCQYVLEIKWINATHAVVLWTNRKQNLYVSCLHDISDGRCREVYKQELPEETASWIPHSMRDGSSLFFSEDYKQMLILAQILDGHKGYFTHVVIVDLDTTRSTPVTHGPFDVHRIASWDPSTDLLYYVASPEGQPSERHLYVTKYEPRNFIEPSCITCTNYTAQSEQDRRTQNQKTSRQKRTRSSSTAETDPPCLYCDAQFSHASSFFVLECLGPGIPTADVYSVVKWESKASADTGISSGEDHESKLLRPHPVWVSSWETNTALRKITDPLDLPHIRRFDIPVENGFVAHVELLLPLYANTEEEDVFQYPLVIAMPQEPGEQQVTEEWDEIDGLFRLSVVKRWIVMRVDLRGSGGEGRSREAEVSRNIGRAETKDLQTVIRHLMGKFSFFNPEKICLCGWGISGFYVLRALAEDGVEYFNCGIAVAPMANWMVADAYMGERIMGFPNLTENVMGFIENDVRKLSSRLHGKDLLVIHGTADSMVLVHNSMALFRSLIQNQVIFHEMIYPDEGHSLKGVISHMHSAMESFLQDAFGVTFEDEDQVSNFLAAAGFG